MTTALLLAVFLPFPAHAADAFPEMRTDPRVELLGMVQLLADADRRYTSFRRHDIPYQRKAQSHFGPYKRHPAVLRYTELSDKGLSYLMAYQFMFSLGDPPGLEFCEQAPAPVVEQMGGAAEAEEFRRLLASFSADSGFPGFYAGTEPERAALLAEVRGQARTFETKAALERYLGAALDIRYEFIISSFAEPVLVMTFMRPDPDGTPRLTSLYGPDEQEGKFGFNFETRIGPIWLELAIAYLTPKAEPFRSRPAKTESLYKPLGAACAPSWYDCVQQNIAFAIGARLLEQRGDGAMAREWPVKYARIGRPYITPLVDTLKLYEKNRDRYPSLEAFYPRLLETIEELAARKPEAPVYNGTIKSILAASGSRAVIAPDDDGASPGLTARLRRLRDKRWPGAEIMTGAQALAADLSGKILIVVGTAGTNSWLGRHYDDLQLPLRIEPGKISMTGVSDNQQAYSYRGRVGLISAALNPFDPTRPVLLYTASHPAALLGTLDGYDDAADYVILKDSRLLKVGLYEKSRVPWRVK